MSGRVGEASLWDGAALYASGRGRVNNAGHYSRSPCCHSNRPWNFTWTLDWRFRLKERRLRLPQRCMTRLPLESHGWCQQIKGAYAEWQQPSRGGDVPQQPRRIWELLHREMRGQHQLTSSNQILKKKRKNPKRLSRCLFMSELSSLALRQWSPTPFSWNYIQVAFFFPWSCGSSVSQVCF